MKLLLAVTAMLIALIPVADAQPPVQCFGAAARDSAAPCDNPSLRYSAKPTPSWAPLETNAPCTPIPAKVLPRVCWFGRAKAGASESVALLGDSHASSWRAALAVLARAQRWHGLTIRHSGCPFSRARRAGPRRDRASCLQWVRSTTRWFARHPEVGTVFATASTFSGVVAPPGADPYAVAVEGFRAALGALPSSVQRVVVLRDTPRSAVDTLSCVARSIAHHEPLDHACALRRDSVLARDPEVDAAAELGAPRFQVIDLTRFFCDDAQCYPVIGGALVFMDISHMTSVFSTSLGPYLQAAYLNLEPS